MSPLFKGSSESNPGYAINSDLVTDIRDHADFSEYVCCNHHPSVVFLHTVHTKVAVSCPSSYFGRLSVAVRCTKYQVLIVGKSSQESQFLQDVETFH